MATQSRLTIEQLMRQLGAKTVECRYQAAEELGRRGVDAKDSIPNLLAALDDHSSYWTQGEHRWVREAAVHALACIDPESSIIGARSGQVIVELLCERRALVGRRSSNTEHVTWADYWATEGITRIQAFGLSVHRAIVRATASQDIALSIAARRVLAAWDKAHEGIRKA